MEKPTTKAQRLKLMGRKGIVTGKYHNKPHWVAIKFKPRPAWITGFGVIREGDAEYDYEYGPYFTHLKTIPVLKVRFWPTQAEINVPYDCFELNNSVEPYPNMAKYSEQCKQAYQDDIKFIKRDEKGRFKRYYQ